jgi:sirohydrochlorin cobaltochelatase
LTGPETAENNTRTMSDERATDCVVVLAMHGAPPRDFPPAEMGEFHALHARLGHGDGTMAEGMRARADMLDRKMRRWPRTADNDPFWAASQEIARHLAAVTGSRVVVGFNEFCGPDLDEALAAAVAGNPGSVVVITPMLTRGGGHAEVDIPAAIARAQAAFPSVPFVYAWPYDMRDVARFLADRLRKADS